MEKDPAILVRVLEEGFEVDSPESIAKWRESRKRNFPTPSNVQRKKSDREIKVERGEKFVAKRLNSKVFRYAIQEEKRGRQKDHRPQLQHSFHNPSSSWFNHRLPPNTSPVVLLRTYFDKVHIDSKGELIKQTELVWESKLIKEEIEEEESTDIVSSSKSSSSFPNPASTAGVVITDDEEEFDSQETTKSMTVTAETIDKPAVPVLGALATLAGYQTDSDLEDGEIDEGATSKLAASVSPITESLSVTETNGTTLVHSTPNPLPLPVPPSSEKGNGHHKKRRRRKNQTGHDEPKRPGHLPRGHPLPPKRMKKSDRQPTLLARLLDDEICQERNAVLCVGRFLIQHNFLEGIENSADMTQELLDCIRSAHEPKDEA